MNKLMLSPRLKVIADFAENHNVVADIGCDHGKVSVYIAKKGAEVHAVDISEPSLQKARELAEVEKVGDRISFYFDDGLESINDIHIDALIIAGMGWRTMGNILEKNIECVKKIRTLILQPMDSVTELRNYICNNGFNVLDEKLAWDDGRLYTVLKARYMVNQKLSLAELILGPSIIKNNDILLNDLIAKECKKREIILHGLLKAKKQNGKQIRMTKKEIKAIKGELIVK